jgi:hypothetical protein
MFHPNPIMVAAICQTNRVAMGHAVVDNLKTYQIVSIQGQV